MDYPLIELQQLLERTIAELGRPHGVVAISQSNEWSNEARSMGTWALDSVIQELIRRPESDRPGSPILVCGLLRSAYLDMRIREIGGRQLALWEWPGFAYLEFGFSEEQLIATTYQIIEGAKTSLPAGILPSVGDLLRMTSEIRHWLENRLRNAEGALDIYERAMRGEIVLHRSHLDPVAALTGEHRAMLDRLWVLEEVAVRFAPRTGGLGPLKSAVCDFESRWETLEIARAVLRAGAVDIKCEAISPVLAAIQQVRDMLLAAIVATRKLDNELTECEED